MSQPTSRPASPARGYAAALQPPPDPATLDARSRSSAQSGGGRTIASYYQGRYDGDMSHEYGNSTAPSLPGSSRDASPPSSPHMRAGLSRRLSRGDPDAAAQIYANPSPGGREDDGEQKLHIGSIATQRGTGRHHHGSSGSATSFYNPLEDSFEEPIRSAPPHPTNHSLAGTLGPYPQSARPAGHGRDESNTSAWGDVGRMQSQHSVFASQPSTNPNSYDDPGPFHLDFSAPPVMTDSPAQSPSLRGFTNLPGGGSSSMAAQGWSQFGHAHEVQSPGELSSGGNSPQIGLGSRSRSHLHPSASPARMDRDQYFGANDTGSDGHAHLSHRSPADVIAGAGGDSPLVQSARAGLDRMSKSIRRVSKRIVGLEQPTDLSGSRGPHIRLAGEENDVADKEERSASKEKKVRTHEQILRGRSLGLFGPDNGFRRIMARMLSNM